MVGWLFEPLSSLAQQNAMLRETLDCIDAGVVVYDSERNFHFGNATYHQAFPHLPPDSVLRRMRYEDVLRLSIAAGVLDDPRAYSDTDAFVAQRCREVVDREANPVRELHHPGRDQWWQIRVNWTPSDKIVALRVDITELKRLQRELLRAQRMETIGRLAGGIAHDFNNLLTVIVGCLEMIQARAPHVPEAVVLATNALAAADAGARLTHELLTFARRDLMRPRVLDPNTLLTGMEELLRRALGPGITLQLDLQAEIASVNVDPGPFEAAIMNLVMNAREAIVIAGGQGSVRVISRDAPASGSVTVEVSDTGCGMTPEVAAQAIEAFFTTKAPGTASGLGLSQAHEFAAAAGGRLTLETRPGGGTRVIIRLPATATPSPAPAATPATLRGGTILVVDDDVDVLATTTRGLAGLGYRLLTASNGEEALDLLAGPEPVDLLLSDVMMPGGMSGVALAVAARKVRPELRVQLISGYAPPVETEGAEALVADMLPKPYRFAELVRRVEALLAAGEEANSPHP